MPSAVQSSVVGKVVDWRLETGDWGPGTGPKTMPFGALTEQGGREAGEKGEETKTLCGVESTDILTLSR